MTASSEESCRRWKKYIYINWENKSLEYVLYISLTFNHQNKPHKSAQQLIYTGMWYQNINLYIWAVPCASLSLCSYAHTYTHLTRAPLIFISQKFSYLNFCNDSMPLVSQTSSSKGFSQFGLFNPSYYKSFNMKWIADYTYICLFIPPSLFLSALCSWLVHNSHTFWKTESGWRVNNLSKHASILAQNIYMQPEQRASVHQLIRTEYGSKGDRMVCCLVWSIFHHTTIPVWY